MSREKSPGGGSPHLSDDDRGAWEETARTVSPLGRERRLKRPTPSPKAEPLSPAPTRVKAPAVRRPALPAYVPAPPVRDAAPPFGEIDRRQTRKLSTGQAEIGARVDLHGLAQNQAHRTLRRFLLSAYEQEVRWVLVITGKGARRPSLDDDAGRDGFMPPRETGVLRRKVPSWLEEPDLREVVAAFRPASQRHGGEGALYVQIRRKRG